MLGNGPTLSGAFNLSLTCTNTPVLGSASVVDNCGGNTFTVPVTITSLGGAASVTVNYSINNVAQAPVTGVTLAGTVLGPFTPGAKITVSVSNGASGCTLNLGDFYSNCPVDLVCGNTLTVTHCYSNNDIRSFTYHAEPGQTVTLTFISGDLAPGDVINGYSGTDNTGTPIPGLTLSGALAGASGTSLGQDLFLQIVADGSGSCADGNPSASNWTFEVECTPACTDPTAIVDENSICATYTFTLSVDVLDYGTGAGAIPETTADLQYTVNGGSPIVITNVPIGVTTLPAVGSFTIGDVVNVVLLHGSDSDCDHNFGNFDGDQGCPPPGYTCALPLVVSTFPYSHTNTTCGSGNDLLGTQCGLGTAYGGGEDFIYQLIIPSAGDYQISMQQTGGASFGGWFLKSSANCGNAGACLANAVNTTPNGTASAIYTFASAGTYYLVIDSRPLPFCFGYVLNIIQYVPLPGETCANAIVIPSVPATVNGNNSAYVDNYNSVCPFTNTGGLDVVYSYTPTVTETLNLTMCLGTTNYDTKLFVFLNSCGGASIACNDDACQAPLYTNAFNSSISNLTVSPPNTYYFVVDAFSGADAGNYTLDISVAPPPPANDECSGAIPLAVNTFGGCPANAVTGSTANATDSNVGEPTCDTGSSHGDVWFTFNSGTNSTILWDFVQGTTSISIVELYTGTCGTLTSVDCDFSFTDISSSWTVTPSTTYYVRVLYSIDFGDTPGTFTLCLSVPPPPPANDLCANAINVTCNSTTNGTTFGATNTETPGACGTYSGTQTAGNVWYTVTGWGGGMTASLCGSSFDTQIAVFTGSCGALTCVDGNDDSDCDGDGFNELQSTVAWSSTNGTVYHIMVTGFDTEAGNFTLEVTCGDNTVACTSNGLTFEFATDQFSTETTWEIIPLGLNTPACSGGGTYPPNAVGVLDYCCLPNGCYRVRVLDAFGDGMYDGVTTGGYILRTTGTNKRIIDNRNNYGDFNAGSSFESAISGQQGFCLPIGADALIYTSCDKLDWVDGEYIVATPNAAVSAQFGGVNAATSGYEFWLFDPNGTYSFRKFRSHTVSDGFAPNNATRACHMKINNWLLANHAPANLLLNVRVRGRVAGVNNEWGPACRFMIDPVRAACPLTKLMDIPGNQYFSCGVTRAYGTGNYVHARPVTGANKYQFRFRIDGENFVTVRNSNTYYVQLNWGVNPLQDGKTYQVEVRASKNNGATWCVDVPSPVLGPPFTQWGDVCDLTIDNTPANAGNENFAPEGANLRMYPNPNRGDQLYVQLDTVEEGVLTVSVDIYDLYGKRVSTRTIAAQDGFVNTVLDLGGDLADGMYLVNITAGEQRYTERLVIQR